MPDVIHESDIKISQGNHRIRWIDIAKGIAILAIILGHTALKNSIIWNWCYTFHVPMFFILSGYTSGIASSWSDVWRHVKKNFLHLIVPCLSIEMIQIIISFFLAEEKTVNTLIALLTKQLDVLFWASGATNADGTIPSLGALWFLIALFYAKLFWDIIYVLFPKVTAPVCIMTGFLGMLIGQRTYLPQELDVVFLVVFFLEVGKYFKRFDESKYYDKFKYLAVFIGFVIWIVCFCLGIRIEIVYRDYPYGVISIIEACCATYCMCVLSRLFDNIAVVRDILSYIGKFTLWIFMVHSLDYLINFMWVNLQSGIYIIAVRVIVDVSLALLLAHIKSFKSFINRK